MGYLDFGIRRTDSFPKPRQAFKPVFEQIFEDSMTTVVHTPEPTAEETGKHNDNVLQKQLEAQSRFTAKIYVASTFALMLMTIATML